MTYHMERTLKLLGKSRNGKNDVEMDNLDRITEEDPSKVRFPDKLFEVLGKKYSSFLHWSEDGESVIVEQEEFEEMVMEMYPGLVQISSFTNFRRLFREYGFCWAARNDGCFVFTHECFQKDREDLLPGIFTKRKTPCSHRRAKKNKKGKLPDDFSPEDTVHVGKPLRTRGGKSRQKTSSLPSTPGRRGRRCQRGSGGRQAASVTSEDIDDWSLKGTASNDSVDIVLPLRNGLETPEKANQNDSVGSYKDPFKTPPRPESHPYHNTFPFPGTQPYCPLWGTYCVPVCPNPAAHSFTWSLSAGDAFQFQPNCPSRPDPVPRMNTNMSQPTPDPLLMHNDHHVHHVPNKLEPWVPDLLNDPSIIPAAGDSWYHNMMPKNKYQNIQPQGDNQAQVGPPMPGLIPAPSRCPETSNEDQGGGAPSDNRTYFNL